MTEPGLFEAFYASAIQHPWMLWCSGVLGLALALTREGLPSGMRRYLLGLGALTLADAWLSSTHVYGIGRFEGFLARAVPLFFVLSGDLRFLYLLEGADGRGEVQLRGGALVRALGLMLIVPLFSQGVLSLLPEAMAGPRTLFIVYEVAFLVLTLSLMRLHPALQTCEWKRRTAGFVLIYYGLWAFADALIRFFGLDLGFAVRVIPNQLYYGGLIAMIGLASAEAARRDQGGQEG